MKLFYQKYILQLFLLFMLQQFCYSNKKHVISLNFRNYDGTNMGIQPGDTVLIEPGLRECLRLYNIHGDSLNNVVFINDGGVVEISSLSSYLGLTIHDCTYFKLTGTGSKDIEYGIRISKTIIGTSGVSLNGTSSNYEIDHLDICNTGFAGFFVNQSPDCNNIFTRNNFVIRNISFHDNYIHNTMGEGFYVGHSFYTGYTVYCDSVETLLYPPEIHGIKLYNNLIDSVGLDGIQVGCATKNCEIFNNKILHYGVKNESFQQSGIQISAGTGGKCYNNLIMNGTGSGINVFGIGGNRIFNNIIINSGYAIVDTMITPNASGIFCDDRYTLPDSSFFFFNNLIISPKRDGIRIYTNQVKNNMICNNIILNPGSYNSYNYNLGKMISFVYKEKDVDVKISNNYFSANKPTNINFNDIYDIYNKLEKLPIENRGIDVRPYGIDIDFFGNPRLEKDFCDIGVFNYSYDINSQKNSSIVKINNAMVFNNNIYDDSEEKILQLFLYDSTGKLIYNCSPNDYYFDLKLKYSLKKGIYILRKITNKSDRSKKIFI